MIYTPEFYKCLIGNQLDFFTGVPDSLLSDFCAYVSQNTPPKQHVIAANEGNAVAMAAGYHLATGKFGVVYMQNSGIGNAVNPLVSLCDEEVYSIPMLLLIGWRGELGVKDEPQHIKQGKITKELLDVMGIPYEILGDEYLSQVLKCLHIMKEEQKPVALIVRRGIFSTIMYKPAETSYILTREQVLETVISLLGCDDFIVSTTGKTSRELYEIRIRYGIAGQNDFLTVGSMGHTASIAFGLSIGTEKNIWCIDGDGAFLMHMGSMGIIAQNAKRNFRYILINNGAHESVGGQPTVGLAVDTPSILHACGFQHVYSAETEIEIQESIQQIKMAESPTALVIYTKQGSRVDLGRPKSTPAENKRIFMESLQS